MMAVWWGLVQNEWLKFRRRRRVWLGVVGLVLLTGLVTLSQVGNVQNGSAAFFAKSDRAQIPSLQASLKHDHGAQRVYDRVILLQTRYDLAAVTGKPLPPLTPIVRATRSWVAATAKGPRGANGYGMAVTAYKDALYARAHHLELPPSSLPKSGWWLVNQVFTGTLLVLFVLLGVLLTADTLGMEVATNTWNRLWLDPPPRLPLLLAKLALALGVAVGVLASAGILLFVSGTLVFGPHATWVVTEVTYTTVPVHYPSGTLLQPVILHARDVTATSLQNLDVLSVVGSFLPMAAIVSVAAALGYLIHQGTVATILAAAFAATPILVLSGNVPSWMAWLPGTYLEFGRWLQGAVLGLDAPTFSLAAALGTALAWLALAWLLVAWHQRRVEL